MGNRKTVDDGLTQCRELFRITAVTISDTGTCIFLVEVYEDDRLR